MCACVLSLWDCINLGWNFKKFLDLDLSDIFPIDTLKLNEFLFNNNISSDYYAIHIRKGDALNTASKLVTEGDVQDLSLKSLLAFFSI